MAAPTGPHPLALVRRLSLAGLATGMLALLSYGAAAHAGPTTTTAGPTTTTVPPTTTTAPPAPLATVTIGPGAKASFSDEARFEPPANDPSGEPVCVNGLNWRVVEGYLLLTRSATTGPLTVSYSVANGDPRPGSPFQGLPGVAYQALPGTVTFADGAAEARIPVVPIAPPEDLWGVATELEVLAMAPLAYFEVTLDPSSDYGVGSPSSVVAIIGGDGGSSCGGELISLVDPDASSLGALARTGPSHEAVLAGIGGLLLAVGWVLLAWGRRLAPS